MTAGRTINTLSQEWNTPLKYIEAVKNVFGGSIDLDPCSNQYSLVNAKIEYLMPLQNGLKESWNYPNIYVNPPYGIDKTQKTSIKDWLLKCSEAYENGSEVLALIPVATNTGHWKKYIWIKANAICFLADTRLKFLINGENSGTGAPMACAMIYWGKDCQKFYETFVNYGAVVRLKNEQK